MATVTINNDGSVALGLSAQEQAQMLVIAKVKGPAALQDGFNLNFQNLTKEAFNVQFAKLTTDDQALVFSKISAV